MLFTKEPEHLLQAAIVRDLVITLDEELQAQIHDSLGDSFRPDVKQILTDLGQDILALKVQIISAADKLASLPDSI